MDIVFCLIKRPTGLLFLQTGNYYYIEDLI